MPGASFQVAENYDDVNDIAWGTSTLISDIVDYNEKKLTEISVLQLLQPIEQKINNFKDNNTTICDAWRKSVF